MRYRPFTPSGQSISAISLLVDDHPMREAERLKLIHAALESGVNGFELATDNPAVLRELGAVIASVGRRLVVLMLRVGRTAARGEAGCFAPEAISAAIDQVVSITGAEHLDAVVLDNPRFGELTPKSIEALERARADRRARLIGLGGEDEATDAYMAASRFDLLATRFNIRSGWPERNRIKAAAQRNMTVIDHAFEVESSQKVEAEIQPKGLARFFRRPDPRVAHAFDFMKETRGWTAEEISLAFALTEPAFASVRVRCRSVEQLERLAAAVERELPTGVSAQIEMARFAAAETRPSS